MNVKLRSIEVDAETAELLEARAKARGMSVAQLLADIAGNEEALPAALSQMRVRAEGPWSPQALDDDARRLAEFERTRRGVPWSEVRSWMQTWGKSGERPAPKSRRL